MQLNIIRCIFVSLKSFNNLLTVKLFILSNTYLLSHYKSFSSLFIKSLLKIYFMKSKNIAKPLPKDVQEILLNAEFILLNILDHMASGKMNKELTMQRLITVCKSFPISHLERLNKYL